LFCPVAKKHSPNGENYGGPHNTYLLPADGKYKEEYASYGLNVWIYDPSSDVTNIQQRPTIFNWRSLESNGADNIPLVLDSMWRGGGPYYKSSKKNHSLQAVQPPEENGQWRGAHYEISHFAMDRHLGGINGVFMDMSVRWIQIKQLWHLKWHRQFQTDGWPNDWPEWIDKLDKSKH
jgi:hypothetical protein